MVWETKGGAGKGENKDGPGKERNECVEAPEGGLHGVKMRYACHWFVKNWYQQVIECREPNVQYMGSGKCHMRKNEEESNKIPMRTSNEWLGCFYINQICPLNITGSTFSEQTFLIIHSTSKCAFISPVVEPFIIYYISMISSSVRIQMSWSELVKLR